MHNKLTKDEYSKMKDLAESALWSPNKQAAKKYIEQLEFTICCVSVDLPRNIQTMLVEMLSAVKDASGAVSDKDRKVNTAHWLLTKAEIYCVE